MLCRFTDRFLLDRRNIRWRTYENTGMTVPTFRSDSIDEMLQHRFRNIKISNDTVSKRPDRNDISGRPPDHASCILADGKNALRVAFYRYNRRFIEDDPFSFHMNQYIRRA
ncbi:hypothetical protein D3C77_573720 [compost metagenome]